MTLEQIFNILLQKLTALAGIIFTSVMTMLIMVTFITMEGNILVKIAKALASVATGMLVGYILLNMGITYYLVLLASNLATLFSGKLIRLLYDQGPDIVWNAAKDLFNVFISKFKNKKDDTDGNN